jgi:hypothetical protein
MNRRGFLLAEETLKIILAVIAILFLIYFLFMLYFSSVHAAKLKQAESILKSSSESIGVAIERVRTTGIAEPKQIPDPNGWYVFGFVSGIKPNACAGKNCLCICENVWKFNPVKFWKGEDERQAQECSDGVTCLVVEDLKNSLEKEITTNTIKLDISFSGGIEIK